MRLSSIGNQLVIMFLVFACEAPLFGAAILNRLSCFQFAVCVRDAAEFILDNVQAVRFTMLPLLWLS